mgnify:CR=1 FL=1
MQTQWNINSLRIQKIEDKQDVVVSVQFVITSSDGEKTAQAQANVELTYNPDAPFVAYSDLTESQVIQWAKNVLTEDEIKFYETVSQNRLTNIPLDETKPLPWVA